MMASAALQVYYDLLFSVYSIPNIVLPLFGGLLVDRAGLYFALILFASLILCGQARSPPELA